MVESLCGFLVKEPREEICSSTANKGKAMPIAGDEKSSTKLIVMLTQNDRTVENAHQIFEECKHSRAKFWGLKESGLPLAQMKKLYT